MSALALSYIVQILSAVPSLIAAGQSVMSTINHATSMANTFIAEKRDPTAEEWAALDAVRDELHKQIQS